MDERGVWKRLGRRGFQKPRGSQGWHYFMAVEFAKEISVLLGRSRAILERFDELSDELESRYEVAH